MCSLVCNVKVLVNNLLFNITTVAIVIQKKAPGQSAELVIASPTVTKNIIISMTSDHTIRVVKLPL